MIEFFNNQILSCISFTFFKFNCVHAFMWGSQQGRVAILISHAWNNTSIHTYEADSSIQIKLAPRPSIPVSVAHLTVKQVAHTPVYRLNFHSRNNRSMNHRRQCVRRVLDRPTDSSQRIRTTHRPMSGSSTDSDCRRARDRPILATRHNATPQYACCIPCVSPDWPACRHRGPRWPERVGCVRPSCSCIVGTARTPPVQSVYCVRLSTLFFLGDCEVTGRSDL